jgi:hypothetical protein
MALDYTFHHDLETILEQLLNPAFIEARSRAMGEAHCNCQVEREADQAQLNSERIVSLDLPKVAQKLFTVKQTMQMKEKWWRQNDGWHGEYHVDVAKQPLIIDARFSLTPCPEGCRFWIEHQPTVDIPLVSGPAKKFITRTAEKGTLAECDYLRDQLA